MLPLRSCLPRLWLTACQGAAPEPPAPWQVTDPVPLLEARLREPVAGLHPWTSDAGRFEYRAPADAPRDPLFASDELATAAARHWMTRAFGMTADEFEVASIDHGGTNDPKAPPGPAEIIVLRQRHRGIATEGVAIVWLDGGTITSAHAHLQTYQAREGTAKVCVTQAAALAAWREELQKRGADAAALARYDAEARPFLCYLTTPSGPDGTVTPTWVIRDGEPYMVDGHTGRTWWND